MSLRRPSQLSDQMPSRNGQLALLSRRSLNTLVNWTITLIASAMVLIVSLLFATAYAAAEGAAGAEPLLEIQGKPLPPSARSEEQARRAAELETFLLETGFPDLSQEIKDNLSRPEAKDLERINRETLEINWIRLQINNHARDLAVELLAYLVPSLGDPASAERTAELAARFLTMKPLALPDAFPDAVRNIPNPEQREEAKTAFLVNAIEKNILRHREQLFSDSVKTVYRNRSTMDSVLNGTDSTERRKLRAQIKRLDMLIGRYVEALYLDHEMGQGRWLGEAFAAGLVHTARLSSDPSVKSFEARLAVRTRAYGEELSDHISDTIGFNDDKGKRREIKIRNADTVMEWSHGPGARLGSSAPRPTWGNRLRAARERLITPYLLTMIAADEAALTEKVKAGERLTLIDKFRLWVAQLPAAKRGFSHGGMALVHTHPKSKVSIVRVIDMYGNNNWGTARWITPKEIYAGDGHYVRFGVASLDPKKLLAFMQEQVRISGYREVFEVTEIHRPNEEGELQKAEGESFQWRVNLTAEEQRQLLDWPIEDAERWYDEVLAPRVTKEMKSFLVKHGMAFSALGEIRNKWAAYCTQGVKRAWLRATGVDIQSKQDKYFWPLRLLARVIPSIRSALPKEPPISPSFMAWDPKTKTDSVSYRLRSPVQAETNRMNARLPDLDPEMTKFLSGFIDRKPGYDHEKITEATYHLPAAVETSATTRVKPGARPGAYGLAPRANRGMEADEGAKYIVYQPASNGKVHRAAELSTSALRAEEGRALSELRRSLGNETSESDQAARLLATEIMTELASRLKEGKDAQIRLVELTAKMMALKPINPPRLFPAYIESAPAGGERRRAIEDYIEFDANERMETQTRQVLSDILLELYGLDPISRAARHLKSSASAAIRERVERLYGLVGTVIEDIHLSRAAADSRALGTALAALLVNQAARTNKSDFVDDLKRSLVKYDLELSDFVSSIAPFKHKPAPGRQASDRAIRRVKKSGNPSLAEIAHVRYSPYVEVQPKLTRALDRILGSNPRFTGKKLSSSSRKAMIRSVIDEYMQPLNKEHGIEARPTAHRLPSPTCSAIFAPAG